MKHSDMHFYFIIPIIGSAVPVASFPFTELLSHFYFGEHKFDNCPKLPQGCFPPGPGPGLS